MDIRHKLFAGAVALASAGLAGAQVTLYGQENFRGRSITVDGSVPDLRGSRLDDRASSISVRGGSWQLCSEPFYTGACVTVMPGDYPSLRAAGLNNAVSSARMLSGPSERIAGAPALVLYDGPNFSGRSLAIDDPADRLGSFNDRARSMIVYDGQWELCEHDRFRGSCIVYGPGRHATIGPLAGELSSLRPIDGYAVRPPVEQSPRVVLYEGPNFRGRGMIIDHDLIANLRGSGFDDRASSLRVEAGNWVLCSDVNFQGQCWTFGPGEYPVLPAALDDSIASARLVQGERPYEATAGSPGWRR